MFMNTKTKFSLISLFLFSSLFSQNIQLNKFTELKNAFVLGLEEKGVEIGHEIISKGEYSKERESTLKFLGDYFLYEAIMTDSASITYALRANTLYNMLLSDYPNSKYKSVIELQLKALFSIFKDLELYGTMYSEYFSEANIVKKLYDIGEVYIDLEDIALESAYKIYKETQSKFLVANKYYDSIILNHPKFEVYGYYLKLLSYLNNYSYWAYSPSKILEKSEVTGIGMGSYFDKVKSVVDDLLIELDSKYPNSAYTMEIHFIYASYLWNDSNHFKKKQRKELTKYHLEKILTNDKDTLGLTYVLTKEFVIRNF